MIKKVVKALDLALTVLVSPSIQEVLLSDCSREDPLTFDNMRHIDAAMKWLCFAQDVTKDDGVSAGYSLTKGWLPSHRDTTGYIILTFLDYYSYMKNRKILERAIRMADWELSVQLSEGGIPYGSDPDNKEPLVFGTGQVILGWCKVYIETNNEKYLNAAKRAADWLISIQDNDGCWRKYVYNDIPHTYNVRVAWALLELFEITHISKYKDAAVKNIEWTLSKQQQFGWFENCAFNAEDLPFTHTLAYTIRGLLEAGRILKEDKYIIAAKKAADSIMLNLDEDGYLSGVFNSEWEDEVSWSCLTGNAQLSIIWLKLYVATEDRRYLEAADSANSFLKRRQNIKTSKKNIRGAIKGSHPVWGKYNQFRYMNWMTKFFIDALILEEKFTGGFLTKSKKDKPT